jgi:glucose-6-phosphate isomerase
VHATLVRGDDKGDLMMHCTFDAACVPPEKLNQYLAYLAPEIRALLGENDRSSCAGSYKDQLLFMKVPADQQAREQIVAVVAEKRALKPAAVVVVGIGGSNLGTQAVYEALRGGLQAETPAAYWADTLDNDALVALKQCLEDLWKTGKTVLLVVISKSGTTLETSLNAAALFELLKKHRPNDYARYLICITGHNSPLWQTGKTLGCATLEIPRAVEGRYSVFSAVGLVPLGLLGIDIDQFCAGARDAAASDVALDDHNYAALGASILASWNDAGYVVHNLFVFDAAYEALGKWHRQLLAESLGKRLDCAGNVVERGLLPIVSLGTVDLHSMVQFYLGGPRTVGTTFVTVAPQQPTQRIAHNEFSPGETPEVPVLMHAIFCGVQRAYQQEARPFVTIALEKSAYDLGYFMQTKMIETVLLGFLLRVNPFDQPEVELYKREVRNCLHPRAHRP